MCPKAYTVYLIPLCQKALLLSKTNHIGPNIKQHIFQENTSEKVGVFMYSRTIGAGAESHRQSWEVLRDGQTHSWVWSCHGIQ